MFIYSKLVLPRVQAVVHSIHDYLRGDVVYIRFPKVFLTFYILRKFKDYSRDESVEGE